MHDPTRYDNYNSIAGHSISQYLPEIIRRMRWKPNEIILDFGCGAGTSASKHLLPMAKLYNSRIEGVDISKVMVEYAQKKYVHPLLQFYHADILDCKSPLTQKNIDRIFSIHVFHLIKDAGPIFDTLFKILQHGGEIGITAITKAPVIDCLEDIVWNSRWRSYTKGTNSPYAPWFGTRSQQSGEENLRKGLEQAGFVISEIRTETGIYADDLEILTEFFLSLATCGHDIPTELTDELKNEFRDGLRKCNILNPDISSASTIQLQYSVVICLAYKP